MQKKQGKNTIVVYQAKSGAIEFRGDNSRETIWATQAQIVELFCVDQSVVSRHVRNIFKDGEIEEKSNMQKMHIANSNKPVATYSLDVILSVGYRTNSKIAIEFRKWATKILREHITKGCTINRKLVAKNYDAFMKAFGGKPVYTTLEEKAAHLLYFMVKNHPFVEEELQPDAVVRNFRTTAADGKTYEVQHYNLDMIISLGYRVKSQIATHFRKWATARPQQSFKAKLKPPQMSLRRNLISISSP